MLGIRARVPITTNLRVGTVSLTAVSNFTSSRDVPVMINDVCITLRAVTVASAVLLGTHLC
jgi:hypothetical protein